MTMVRLKVLSRKKVGKGTALDGVLKEIGVMKQLQHPNCVQLYEVIDDKAHDAMYLVMELVDGCREQHDDAPN